MNDIKTNIEIQPPIININGTTMQDDDMPILAYIIANLTVIQATELSQILREKYGMVL